MNIPACRFFNALAQFCRRVLSLFVSPAVAQLVVLSLASGFAQEAVAQDYLFTNDDLIPNGVSFYTIGSNGALTFSFQLQGPGGGIGGGFFGMNRLAALNIGSTQCIFASEAFTNDVLWIVPGTGVVGGATMGSQSDTGTSNGIGLAANAQYLYASFSGSSTIATFQVQQGCALAFVSDVVVGGLNGGFIDGMAVHGTLLIASYADGSIESFNIASGTPVANGDKQASTGSAGGASYPNGIDITQDGHFAIFGDTSTADIVEVSDISAGRLTATTAYRTRAGISSSDVLLSPDETILYITNTQGAAVSAVFFDKNTGRVTPGCTSHRLRNYVQGWTYLGGLALQQISGNGGGVYVAEFGGPSAIAVLDLTVNGSRCTLQESAASPVADPNSRGLLSIGRFPPRPF